MGAFPDRAIEGTVEHIGWRLTRIRTFDQRPLYVPNSLFTTVVLENPSRMLNRRINEKIGIRYDDWRVMPDIVAAVRQMLIDHQDTETDYRTLIVNFDHYGIPISSSLSTPSPRPPTGCATTRSSRMCSCAS